MRMKSCEIKCSSQEFAHTCMYVCNTYFLYIADFSIKLTPLKEISEGMKMLKPHHSGITGDDKNNDRSFDDELLYVNVIK